MGIGDRLASVRGWVRKFVAKLWQNARRTGEDSRQDQDDGTELRTLLWPSDLRFPFSVRPSTV